MDDSNGNMKDLNNLLSQLLTNANQQKKRVRTKEECEEKFKNALFKYVEVKDVDNVESFRSVIVKLSKYYYLCKDFALPTLLTCKFPMLFVKALETLQSKDIFSSTDSYVSVFSIYNLCFNASFASESFSEQLIENGILPLISTVLTNPSYLSQFQNDEKIKELLNSCLGALTNIIRVPDSEEYFKQNQESSFKKAMIKFIFCPYEIFNIGGVIVLARIVTETEYPLLDCCCKFVDYFISSVADAIQSSNSSRCSSVANEGFTSSLIEVTEALSFLSNNVKIKEQLLNTEIVSLMLEIIEQQQDEKEIFFACKTLYNLLQHKREAVSDTEGFKVTLQKVENHSSQAIKIIVKGIINLVNVNDSDDSKQQSLQISEDSSNTITDWNEIQVYAWLMGNDAECCADKMQQVTGKVLEILHKMQVHAPETLEKALSEQFELTDDEASKFLNVLNRLELP